MYYQFGIGDGHEARGNLQPSMGRPGLFPGADMGPEIEERRRTTPSRASTIEGGTTPTAAED